MVSKVFQGIVETLLEMEENFERYKTNKQWDITTLKLV